MRIVYKKPILEQIEEAIIEARKTGKEIEKIIITEAECELLKVQNRGLPRRDFFLIAPHKGFVKGIPLFVEDTHDNHIDFFVYKGVR